MNQNVTLTDETKLYRDRFMWSALLGQANLLFSILQDMDDRLTALEKRPRPGRKPGNKKTDNNGETNNKDKADAETA